jgi:GNAT superfamily N-acetyltransferase
MADPQVWSLDEADVAVAATVLSRSFGNEPLHAAGLPGVDAETRAARLRPLFEVTIRYGLRYGGVNVVGRTLGRIEGVALWLDIPGGEVTEERMAGVGLSALPPELKPVVSRILEAETEVDEILAKVLPSRNRYVGQIGVAPESQGSGLGRALLRHVLARAETDARPLCLWTADPANLPFNRGCGMVQAAEGITLDGTLPWWAFRSA